MNGKRVDRFILSVLRTPEDNLYALGVEIRQGEKISSRISWVEDEPVIMLKSPRKKLFPEFSERGRFRGSGQNSWSSARTRSGVQFFRRQQE